jgi:hypothetical protein
MEEERVTYLLLAESPDKIENWIKNFARIEPNVTWILSLANVNDEFMDKLVVWKWPPAALKLLALGKGRGKRQSQFRVCGQTKDRNWAYILW